MIDKSSPPSLQIAASSRKNSKPTEIYPNKQNQFKQLENDEQIERDQNMFFYEGQFDEPYYLKIQDDGEYLTTIKIQRIYFENADDQQKISLEIKIFV